MSTIELNADNYSEGRGPVPDWPSPGTTQPAAGTPTSPIGIIRGIFGGINKNNQSAALTPHNVTQNNPHSFAWIGRETNDLRQPIQKDQTQNPAVPWLRASSGTQYSYTNPLPTDIPTSINSNLPDTSVSFTDQASQIGSLIQTFPNAVSVNNLQHSGYEMSPTDASHFKKFFANQLGTQNRNPLPVAAKVMMAVQDQQNQVTDGHANVWNSFYQTIKTGLKGYNPLGIGRLP